MFSLLVTPEFLAFLLAGLAAIVFDWFPGLAAWFDGLSVLKKKQLMAAVLALIVASMYGLGCAGVLTLACTKQQIVDLVPVWLIAAGINQGIHQLTKPS